jgi:hypothetical protein
MDVIGRGVVAGVAVLPPNFNGVCQTALFSGCHGAVSNAVGARSHEVCSADAIPACDTSWHLVLGIADLTRTQQPIVVEVGGLELACADGLIGSKRWQSGHEQNGHAQVGAKHFCLQVRYLDN